MLDEEFEIVSLDEKSFGMESKDDELEIIEF